MRNRRTNLRLPIVLLTIGLMTLLCAGCSTFKKGAETFKKGAETFKIAPPAQLPQFINRETADAKPVRSSRMAVIWTDAVYNEPGKPTTRGFGGRIYFYDRHHQSVPVDGELIIYAYDDSTQETGTSKVPKRKFVFPPEKLALHYSKTELGHSYSVWLPWDGVGGEQKEISLVPVFQNTGGQVVKGEPSKTVLPGSVPSSVEGIADRRRRSATVATLSAIRPTKYQSTGLGESSLETTTINLSPSLKRQLESTPVMPTLPVTKPSTNASVLSQRTMSDNAQVSYGSKPNGWNNTAITQQQIAMPNPPQSRTAAFGAPGSLPTQRYASAQTGVANHPNATAVYPQSVHSGHPISPALGAPNFQQAYGSSPNQPFPSTPQYVRPYVR